MSATQTGDSPDTVYKFLPIMAGIHVLKRKHLRVSLLTELNDVFDCYPLFEPPDAESDIEEYSRRIVEEYAKYYGLISFSRTCASPLLWGHYAVGATGLAIEFDASRLRRPALPWVDIDYNDERQKIPFHREGLRNDQEVAELMGRWFGTKGAEWRYENEARCVVEFRGWTPQCGRYYLPFSPESVTAILIGFRSPVPVSLHPQRRSRALRGPRDRDQGGETYSALRKEVNFPRPIE